MSGYYLCIRVDFCELLIRPDRDCAILLEEQQAIDPRPLGLNQFPRTKSRGERKLVGRSVQINVSLPYFR